MTLHPPRPTLFPYTTLFRSDGGVVLAEQRHQIGDRRVSRDGFEPAHHHVLDRPQPSRLTRRSRSEEHTSELQSRENIVCRLLLEKKNRTNYRRPLPSTRLRT